MNKPPTDGIRPARIKKTITPRSISLKILSAVEHERERIGQDLHDDICQILTGVSCLVQVSAGRVRGALPKEAVRLEEINARIIDAMNRARAICHGLHPVNRIGSTIIDTMNELAHQSAERFGIKVSKKLPKKGTQIPHHTDEQLAAVFRIAQEAVCNAVRHGQATKISLRLSARAKGQLCLQIEDNGTGISARKKNRDGLGLRLIRIRARQLRGEIELGPRPRASRGTMLTLTYSPNPSLHLNNHTNT